MPRALPEERDRYCPKCAALKAAGNRPKVVCVRCYQLNPYLIPDDDPSVIRAKAIVSAPKIKKMKGMSNGPTPAHASAKVGTLEAMTPEQKLRYHERLNTYLARARRLGKRTDGNYANPYKLAAINVALGCHASGKKVYASRRRRWAMKAYLSRIERSKMFHNSGLPFMTKAMERHLASRKDWRGVQPVDAPKPAPMFNRSVYNPV